MHFKLLIICGIIKQFIILLFVYHADTGEKYKIRQIQLILLEGNSHVISVQEMTRIKVISKKNYRTEVFVDGVFAYESFLHAKAEIKNLKKLVDIMKIENTEVVGDEE